jgi:hypothetical protein
MHHCLDACRHFPLRVTRLGFITRDSGIVGWLVTERGSLGVLGGRTLWGTRFAFSISHDFQIIPMA